MFFGGNLGYLRILPTAILLSLNAGFTIVNGNIDVCLKADNLSFDSFMCLFRN